MKFFWQTRRKIYGYFIISVSMLIIAIVAGKIFQHDFNHQKALDNFQSRIIEKENAISTALQKLIISYNQSPDSVFFGVQRYEDAFQTDGFVFLVVEADSLVFWSDNRVPFDFLSDTSPEPIVNTGNAWFRIKSIRDKNETRYIGMYLLKFDYNYQNNYLENTFHQSFDMPCSARLTTDNDSGNPVYTEDGTYLFSIIFNPKTQLTSNQVAVLFLLYLSALIVFVVFLYELYLRVHRYFNRRLLLMVAFVFDLLLIRGLIFYFRVPQMLHDSQLFSPHFYAHSEWIPSFGDLFLNVLFLLVIAFFVFYHYKFDEKIRRRRPFFRYFFTFSLLLHVFIFFKGLSFLIASLISDSIISLDLNNIFSLSWMSLFSFIVIAMAILAYLLVTAKMTYQAFKAVRKFGDYAIIALIVFLIWLVVCYLSIACDWVYAVFVFIYVLTFGLFYHYGVSKFNLSAIVIYILLFSGISTYALHKYNDQKEKEHRKLLALHLASEKRDPVAEFVFNKNVSLIQNDTLIRTKLESYNDESDLNGDLEDYIVREYFSEYWRRYDHQVTICSSNDQLLLRPDEVAVDCWMFFQEMILSSGKQTQNPALYFLNFGTDDTGYLAVLEFEDIPDKPEIKIFVELTPKYVSKDLGFPDLLIDREISTTPDFTDYSYANYLNGDLQQRVGKYFFNTNLEHYGVFDSGITFLNRDQYSHCVYVVDESRAVIISIKNKSFLDIIAPVSYLFLFYALFTGVFFLGVVFPLSRRQFRHNFRARLQLSMSAVILFSFLVIGLFTLFYIQNLNAQKNNDILSEKTHSILVEMQHKLSEAEQIDANIAPYVSELLVKFSNVFFTDINLFGRDGHLIASSRSQIYDEKLLSRKMHPIAYKELTLHKSSLFIQNENIGKQNFLSAYIPFVNHQNNVIAYLNLPYFAKENDLKREISSFLVAYINIYVILIAITILIALIISNYVSRPIKLIMSKIREINLGGQNEKIEWKHDDEIGQLVLAYNRMIDELAISADLLARSERETAWREMARQVAHEIKNPLTPMKLSVQYLQHAWNSKTPGWENRLQKFTNTMIEQIDALSKIATEFSDFAKMPSTKPENVDISDLIQNVISLFKNYENITIRVIEKSDQRLKVLADKDQLMRAFNNLLKNSVQAIGRKKEGKIRIETKRLDGHCIIEMTDNGGGIPEEIAGKIFSPNFTTKSGGMGLGLAIVKSIIVNSGGDIDYISHPGEGTTFIIQLPLY
jgi:two-component system, NtrC family, nitrogen regulation sensor histidine kinase NtrY